MIVYINPFIIYINPLKAYINQFIVYINPFILMQVVSSSDLWSTDRMSGVSSNPYQRQTDAS